MDHYGNEKEATQDPGIPREEYPEYGCSRAAKIHVILHARDERLCRGKKIEMSMYEAAENGKSHCCAEHKTP